MASPQVILLDAAGTLIHTAEPVAAVYERVVSRHGIELDRDRLRTAFGESFAAAPLPDFATHAAGDAAERQWWREVVKNTIHAAGGSAEVPTFESCFSELFEHFAAGTAWQPFPEVPELLARLKSRGHQLAVVSNFVARLHRVLAELDLDRELDLILTSADVRSRKPEPDLLIAALEHFRVPASAACLAGDHAREDGGAAAAAGIDCFLLTRPHTTLLDFERWLAEYFPAK